MNPEVVSASLTSVPVLAFALGLAASRLKTDLRISKNGLDAISFVLLLAIGLKGGAALQSTPIESAVLPILATIGLGIAIPLIAFLGLSGIRRLSQVDRGAIAAHYGSTSLVTFAACLVFLESANVEYDGVVTTLLVVMEIPGILVGILLASGGLRAIKNRELVKEVFFGKTVLLLLGGVFIGYVSGPSGMESVKLLFVEAQPGLLTLFLLALGFTAGDNFKHFKELGLPLVSFAIAMPLIGGTLGALAGTLVGLSAGGAAALAVLCASASYIAAPAAVSVALPQANQAIPITASLGVTFPFNLIVGLPIYLWLAQQASSLLGA